MCVNLRPAVKEGKQGNKCESGPNVSHPSFFGRFTDLFVVPACTLRSQMRIPRRKSRHDEVSLSRFGLHCVKVSSVFWRAPIIPETIVAAVQTESLDTHESTKIEADAVVCTLPLGVLKDQSKKGRPEFSPALPPEKEKAIAELGYGVVRLVAFFCFVSVAGLDIHTGLSSCELVLPTVAKARQNHSRVSFRILGGG